MSVYMGPVLPPDAELRSSLAAQLGKQLRAFRETGSIAYLLASADALLAGSSWDDPRDSRPWTLAASAVLDVYRQLLASGESEAAPAAVEDADSEMRRALLALAEDLLLAPELSLRRIQSRRILEGLLSRRLAVS